MAYWESISSGLGIAGRRRASISRRELRGRALAGTLPERSTPSKTLKRMRLAARSAAFGRELEMPREAGLLRGETVEVDLTTRETNAAGRALARRDGEARCAAALKQPARAPGIDTLARAALAKPARERPGKETNKDWVQPPIGAGRSRRQPASRAAVASQASRGWRSRGIRIAAVRARPPDHAPGEPTP